MKILQFFPGKIWGGAEQYGLDLAEALKSTGHDVVLVGWSNPQLDKALAGKPHYTLKPSFFKGKATKALARIIRKESPDVVHVNSTACVPIVFKAIDDTGLDVRVVMTRHEARGSRTKFWQDRYFRRIDRIICVSDLVRRNWLGANSWIKPQNAFTIINSIPDRKKKQDGNHVPLREKYGIPGNVPLLMFSGRVRKSKGCGEIIAALGKVKDLPWQMVFIGGCKPADYDKELMKEAERLGIADRIHFMGFVTDSRDYLAEADLALAPSIMKDPCPLSPIEFMKTGKCVIVSDSGGQKEYVSDHKTGIIIEKGNTDQLADAIREMLEKPALREEIGKEAERYFRENLSYPRFLDKVVDIYESAVNNP